MIQRSPVEDLTATGLHLIAQVLLVVWKGLPKNLETKYDKETQAFEQKYCAKNTGSIVHATFSLLCALWTYSKSVQRAVTWAEYAQWRKSWQAWKHDE